MAPRLSSGIRNGGDRALERRGTERGKKACVKRQLTLWQKNFPKQLQRVTPTIISMPGSVIKKCF